MHDVNLETRFAALRGAKLPNFPAYDHFGRNRHGYDQGGPEGEGDDEDKSFDETDFGDGAPGCEVIAKALKLWAASWGRFDPETAAVVFNLAPSLIIAAAPEPADYATSRPLDPEAFDFPNLVQLISLTRYQYIDGADGQAGTSVPCTCAEVAALLNVSEEAVKAAVEQHYWMLLWTERDGSPTIEHEGE